VEVSPLPAVTTDEAAGTAFGVRIVLKNLAARHCGVKTEEIGGNGKLGAEPRDHNGFIRNVHASPLPDQSYNESLV
jgi:hypothetical protein